MERRYLGSMCRFSLSVERYSLTCQERGGEGERGRGEEEEDVYSFYSVSSSLPHGTERRARGSERVINRESRSARLVG